MIEGGEGVSISEKLAAAGRAGVYLRMRRKHSVYRQGGILAAASALLFSC